MWGIKPFQWWCWQITCWHLELCTERRWQFWPFFVVLLILLLIYCLEKHSVAYLKARKKVNLNCPNFCALLHTKHQDDYRRFVIENVWVNQGTRKWYCKKKWALLCRPRPIWIFGDQYWYKRVVKADSRYNGRKIPFQ